MGTVPQARCCRRAAPFRQCGWHGHVTAPSCREFLGTDQAGRTNIEPIQPDAARQVVRLFQVCDEVSSSDLCLDHRRTMRPESDYIGPLSASECGPVARYHQKTVPLQPGRSAGRELLMASAWHFRSWPKLTSEGYAIAVRIARPVLPECRAPSRAPWGDGWFAQ